MSRSNYDKPFYVDVGTSIVAVRCASNHDVVFWDDHVRRGKWAIKEAERVCARLNAETDRQKMHEACRAMRSSAVEMHEACRAMNDDGDPDLCEKLDCPYYGEPNGCNAPTGEYPLAVSAVTMREACQKTRDLLMRRGNGKCQCVLPWDEFNYAQKMLRAALSAPARNCDLYATYAEAAEAHKEYATAYIARSSNMFDFPMEFDEWLFALAAEREGDGDESK